MERIASLIDYDINDYLPKLGPSDEVLSSRNVSRFGTKKERREKSRNQSKKRQQQRSASESDASTS